MFVGEIRYQMTNSTALIHVARSFDLKTHVITLIFVDAFLCTFCCTVSLILNSLIVSNCINLNAVSCNIGFVAAYLPSFMGSGLTLLV